MLIKLVWFGLLANGNLHAEGLVIAENEGRYEGNHREADTGEKF